MSIPATTTGPRSADRDGSTMRAYVLPGPGRPPELADVPRPTPADDEVLLRVLSTSVNPVDGQVISGFFEQVQEHRYPAVFGRDVCGEVVAAGRAVAGLRVGDVVWGFIKRGHIGDGTFAEYVACRADRFVVRKPDGLSVVDAGTLGLASITALECLDALALEPGGTVFVNRATGGVGCFAVQIAAARGLRVIATARPGEADRLLRSLGADETVDWTRGDLPEQVLTLAPGGVDGMVDLLRRDRSARLGMDQSDSQAALAALAGRVLRPGGRFTSVTNGGTPELLAAGVAVNIHSEPTAGNLAAITELVERGRLVGCTTATFPFEAIAAAFEHQRGHGLGKTAVVLAVDGATTGAES